MNQGELDVTAETKQEPEWMGCNEGYVFYRDESLARKWVKLFDESGRLLAMVPDVHHIHFAPIPR